jgi:Na+-driven multidrug efflux pump
MTVGLIKMMGITGAPTATVLTSYVMTAVYVQVVGRLLDIQAARIFPWRSLGKTMMVSIVAIGLASLFRFLDLSPPAMLGSIFVLFGFIYLIIFRLARILEDRERDAVRSLLPSALRWVV